MATRIPYIEALRKVNDYKSKHRKFFDSIDEGVIGVRCERMTQCDFCVLDFHLDDYKTDDVIYIDPLLLDHETGIIRVRNIAELKDGLHQWPNPPYWHVRKQGGYFTIFMSAREGVIFKEPTLLDVKFLRRAILLNDWSAIVDDIEGLVRRQAHHLTVDYRAFINLFAPDGDDGLEPARKPGRRKYYTSADCDQAFLRWHRINPMASWQQRVDKLRAVYREQGFRVGTDKIAKIEIRKIKELIG